MYRVYHHTPLFLPLKTNIPTPPDTTLRHMHTHSLLLHRKLDFFTLPTSPHDSFVHLQPRLQTFRHLHTLSSTIHYLAEQSLTPLISSEVREKVDKKALTKCCSLVRRHGIINLLSSSAHYMGLGSEHSLPPLVSSEGRSSVEKEAYAECSALMRSYTHILTQYNSQLRPSRQLHTHAHTRHHATYFLHGSERSDTPPYVTSGHVHFTPA